MSSVTTFTIQCAGQISHRTKSRSVAVNDPILETSISSATTAEDERFFLEGSRHLNNDI